MLRQNIKCWVWERLTFILNDMKKFFLTALVGVLSCMTYAQDCYIPVSITIEGVSDSKDFAAVESQVRRAFNTENITATEGALFNLSILPEKYTTETITGIRPTVVAVYDLHLNITNTVTNEQFATASIRIQGSGKNLENAIKSAARSLKADNNDLIGFTKKARKNIINYYDDNLDITINQVRQAMQLRQIEKCMWYLSSIPSCIKRYDEVISLSATVFDKYLTLDCSDKMSKAQAAWAASPDQEGAMLAISYLAGIDRESSCNEEAQKLVAEIKEAMGNLYADRKDKADRLFELDLELQRANVDNEKARIEAMRAIGVAYGQNQVDKNETINNFIK